MPLETLFNLANLVVLPFWALMVFAPPWRGTRRIMVLLWAVGALIEPSVARRVFAEFARLAPAARPAQLDEPLSERELEVLRLVAEGLSNKEIGHKLSLAEGTVKNYVTGVLGKIGARDRTQAALRARELGLI
ncbi:MAG: DUF4281 domain-containing protein [Anaerolineales bacterium]|nr:DUF4281 domain-containing protein [Anaerolineales bacterium]